jgi:zinc transporter, ZIP family
MMEENLLLAIVLTLLAGLSTGLGAMLIFLAKKPKNSHLSFALGLSAGVMVYISLVELLPEAQHQIAETMSEKMAEWIAIGSFFLGIAISAIIDRLIPDAQNPHEVRSAELLEKVSGKSDKSGTPGSSMKGALMRTGTFTALAIGIHNFPEGFATFMGTLADPGFGVSIAFAVAVHNIPEGISVSVPIYFATKSRKQAFAYSFLSGMAEPVGALIGYLILRPFINNVLMGVTFGVISGIMVFISLDELLPAAKEYGKGHTAIAGVVLGMAIMAVSLVIM